jgi:hypothetical protein
MPVPPLFASGLSDTPRIAQGGKPSQGVTAINPVMHQEAFDECAHLVFRGRRSGKCLNGSVPSSLPQHRRADSTSGGIG